MKVVTPGWWRLVALAGLLYMFLVGLDMMGLAFKLFGKGLAQALMTQTSHPFVGLLIGVLATSLVQSSSTTTSMTVGLVAGGALSIEGAIPIIMGANIGTSVTNTMVSMAHVTRREEFRRAFAGATVHDFFNWLTVLVLLPTEIAFGYLAHASQWLASFLEGVGGIKLFDPLKAVVRPVAESLSHGLGRSGWFTLLVGVGLTFVALKFLVDVLRSSFSGKAEAVLHRHLLQSPLRAMAAGAGITMMVQSSSVTTSAMVPLVAAGVITLEQLFPLTVGANLGTTVTALFAALVTGSPAAVSVALSHCLFNLTGAALIYGIPAVRRVPLAFARGLGAVAERSRLAAVSYVLVAFYGLPVGLLFASGALDRTPPPAEPPRRHGALTPSPLSTPRAPEVSHV